MVTLPRPRTASKRTPHGFTRLSSVRARNRIRMALICRYKGRRLRSPSGVKSSSPESAVFDLFFVDDCRILLQVTISMHRICICCRACRLQPFSISYRYASPVPLAGSPLMRGQRVPPASSIVSVVSTRRLCRCPCSTVIPNVTCLIGLVSSRMMFWEVCALESTRHKTIYLIVALAA